MGNVNFKGGAGINIFQDGPAWGRNYIKIFQVYPPLFCPHPSRLQLSHLVSRVITAGVECSCPEPSKYPLSTKQGRGIPCHRHQPETAVAEPLWSPQPWVVVKIVLGFSWSHGAGGGSVSPPGGITRHMLPGALAGRGKRSSRPASGRPRRWKPDQRGAQTV
jgi:hypothetical protein